jgi:hypothetical protein
VAAARVILKVPAKSGQSKSGEGESNAARAGFSSLRFNM